MTSTFSRLLQRFSLAAVLVGLPGLSGCYLVNENSSMNIETFQDQVSPVWNEPARNPPAMAQPVPEKRDLYQTQFHQTYGMPNPAAAPVSRLYYGETRDDDRTLPAIPVSRVDPRFLRQEVAYQTAEKPGTIVVDTREHFLYLVEPDGKAMRYGVGLGRQGYSWKGRGVIAWKQKWPRWTPSDDMVQRQPELRPVSASEGGLEAGLNNPLGARALYIYKDGKDTLYRVHGTPDWMSVGKATSSGCVRMFNQDVIDLFDRVRDKAPIVVI